MKIFTVLYIFALIIANALGGCLNDYDTGHGSADYATRLYSYSPSKPAAIKSGNEFTFMSFNLQSGFLFNCQNSPSSQIAQMTSSDYVGTQETVQNVDTRCSKCVLPKLIADGAGMYTRYLMTIPFRTGQYGINAGTSQNILETKYTLFSYSGVEQRGCIAVRTQPPGLGGRNLWFINTHVEYYVWAARQSQLTQLVSFAQSLANADPNCIIVVTGDFNGGPEDAGYTKMKTFFQNSWEVFNKGPGGGNTHPADYPGERFDHIWYRVPSSVTATPTKVEVLNVLLSDHRPMRSTIKFTGSGTTSTPATTPAPSTPAPTAASTQAPPKGATSAPTTPAPSSGGSCSVSVSTSSSGTVTVKNTGSKAVKKVVLTFSPAIPSNNWNLISQGNNKYTLPDFAFGSLQANGQSYSSSGYYTTGALSSVTAEATC